MEGKELGLQKGWEIGQEVGFYAGCVQVCNLLACNADFAESATLALHLYAQNMASKTSNVQM